MNLAQPQKLQDLGMHSTDKFIKTQRIWSLDEVLWSF
jgi:hypothetical protein